MTPAANRARHFGGHTVPFETRAHLAELIRDVHGYLNDVNSTATPAGFNTIEMDVDWRECAHRESVEPRTDRSRYAVGVTAVRASGEVSHTAYTNDGGRLVPVVESE